MRTRHLSLWLLFVSVSLGAHSPTFAQGPQGSGLPQRVEALEAQVAVLQQQIASLTRPLTIGVDCSAGETIQAALDSVQGHPGSLRIIVFGVCEENVRVFHSDVLIRGGAAGAGIKAADPALFVIRTGIANGSLTLELLEITGGRFGVAVSNGAQATLAGCIVTGNEEGISVSHHGIVRLSGSGRGGVAGTIVHDNTGIGISARDGSHVVISGGAVRNNGSGFDGLGSGIALGNGSTASIGDSAEIASNGGYGIGLNGGSTLALRDAIVSNNGLSGVNGGSGSIVSLFGTTITGNTQDGVTLTDTSVVSVPRVEADIHVTNNGRYGLNCSPSPAVAMIVGFINLQDISGNTRGDINCPKSPPPPQ